MKFRLIEEHDPIRDTTIYYTEKRILGLWLRFLSFVEASCTHDLTEARARFDRITKAGTPRKVRQVIELVQQRQGD